MKVLIVLCLVAGAFARCPANSHYEGCGTACPLTCDNYQDPPIACILMCNPGCHCDEGYVKDNDGNCVKPEQCPNSASSNDLCEQPAETGMCRGYFPRFHFDSASGECKEFIYGGCGGNGNNFKTLDECHNTCGNSKSTCGANERYTTCGTSCPLTCDNFQNPPKICNFMCNIGCECEEGYVRSADGRCVKPENCPARALNRPDCDKAPETGLCDAYFPRFYYDQEAGMCKKFIYGGCGGNRNNFETEFDCYNKCGALASSGLKAACHQEKEIGPCRALFPRYFYNKQSGQCELFGYGGCQGNDNNFATKDECEETCLA